MPDTPLNPDAEVSKDQTIFAYEAAERDYPQHGSIMLKLHHSNFQSSLWQVSKRTAESLRDQLNDLLAVAQPEVNSVEELDALPAGSIILHDEGFTVLPARRSFADGEWYVTGSNEYRRAETLLPATVLYRPGEES